jgi:hypothetical protein
MTTALAKALVEGLDGEGVEQVWSNLNRRNAPAYVAERPLDGWLFHVAPESFVKGKRRPGIRRRRKQPDEGQPLLFDL